MSKLGLDELTDLFLLLSVEGIGPGKARNLLSRLGSPEDIISAPYHHLIGVEGISVNLARRIQKIPAQRDDIKEKTIKLLDKLNELDARIVTIWDEEYPYLLKKIYDPPILFYIKGTFYEEFNSSIAVVGTRTPTEYGKIQCEKITADLAQQGIPVISGMARGIDSVAHRAALKHGGKTLAVTGSGLDVIYPPENKKLFAEISGSGAVISEFPPGTAPDAPNFPRRNRIVSGLSLGVLVVETAVTGGALQTAAFAIEQNREVFAVPGNLGVRQSEGTNRLIQKGEAKLVRNAEDILVELQLKLKPAAGKNIPVPHEELSLFEEKILEALTDKPQQIDKIAQTAQLSTNDSLVHLLTLEFKGLVKQLPGKMFVRM